MTAHPTPGAPILIAVPDDWRTELCDLLAEARYALVVATTYAEAQQLLETQPLSGVVLTSDWAMSNASDNTPGLMSVIKNVFPSVTLVKHDGGHRWFDEVFNPPLHEYCSVPFDEEELLNRVQLVGMRPAPPPPPKKKTGLLFNR